MFDPTAFDNMRVVIEGALYDRDLDGELAIIDRNDLMNMAKLERRYEITFMNRSNTPIKCTLLLEGKLENLAAELQPSFRNNNRLIGAHLLIIFNLEHAQISEIYRRFEDELSEIWGEERTIKQKVSYDPLGNTTHVLNEVTVSFNRLILEDQIDDLVIMLDYIEESMKKLEHILNQSKN